MHLHVLQKILGINDTNFPSDLNTIFCKLFSKTMNKDNNRTCKKPTIQHTLRECEMRSDLLVSSLSISSSYRVKKSTSNTLCMTYQWSSKVGRPIQPQHEQVRFVLFSYLCSRSFGRNLWGSFNLLPGIKICIFNMYLTNLWEQKDSMYSFVT